MPARSVVWVVSSVVVSIGIESRAAVLSFGQAASSIIIGIARATAKRLVDLRDAILLLVIVRHPDNG
jgi:hypothetical protein